MKRTILLGQSGALGAAILRRLNSLGVMKDVVCLDSRKLFDSLALRKPYASLTELVRGRAASIDVICAAGVINPACPEAFLRFVNAASPAATFDWLNLSLQHLAGAPLVRFFTFGSVLENDRSIAESNPYIDSKRQMLLKREERIGTCDVRWHHLQLHTLYGGDRQQPFMFLGQLKSAMQNEEVFRMSCGLQLREYHHVDDIAVNVTDYIAEPLTSSRVIHLSAGRAIRLCDLASELFSRFGRSEQLRVGVLPSPPVEIYESNFERSEYLVAYREPVAGVAEWLGSQGIKPRR